MLQIDFVYSDAWPVTIFAIVLDGDSIEIRPEGYKSRVDCYHAIVDSIVKTAKFIPESIDGAPNACRMMFNSKVNWKECVSLGLEINEKTNKSETFKLVPIDGGCLNLRFTNIQAIVMITQKDNLRCCFDCPDGIEYSKIPEEVYVPLFIINAEKTDDLKVKFKN